MYIQIDFSSIANDVICDELVRLSILPEKLQKRSIIQEISDPALDKVGVRFLVKRDDLIHPYLSGNKWRKLKYNLEKARSLNKDTILTFGGAYSNKPELIKFINRIKRNVNIPLDPVYSGKMFFGLFDMIKKGQYSRGTTMLAIHTGGVQGTAGFNQRFGDIIR